MGSLMDQELLLLVISGIKGFLVMEILVCIMIFILLGMILVVLQEIVKISMESLNGVMVIFLLDFLKMENYIWEFIVL